MPAGCSQRQRYGRIDVRTANCSRNVNTEHNSKTPSKNDDNPFVRKRVRRNFIVERKGGYTTIAEEDQYHCTEKFSNHFTIGAREWRRSTYRLTCHGSSLHSCSCRNRGEHIKLPLQIHLQRECTT